MSDTVVLDTHALQFQRREKSGKKGKRGKNGSENRNIFLGRVRVGDGKTVRSVRQREALPAALVHVSMAVSRGATSARPTVYPLSPR